jgi:hypothetical protein
MLSARQKRYTSTRRSSSARINNHIAVLHSTRSSTILLDHYRCSAPVTIKRIANFENIPHRLALPLRQKRSAMASIDADLADIVIVDQLHSDTWAEGIAVRPSGQILATRIDEVPEIYIIDMPGADTSGSSTNGGSSTAPHATSAHRDSLTPPVVIHTFDRAHATGANGICRLTGTDKEEYAVLSGWADFPEQRFRSVAVWRLSFVSLADRAPTVTKIADLPDAKFCLGIEAISDDTLVIVDVVGSRLWRVNVHTAKVSVLLDDPPTMRVKSPEELFPINRSRVTKNFLWYYNHSTGILYRTPIKWVDRTDGRDIEVTGSPAVVAEGIEHGDGLVVRADETVVYMSGFILGTLYRVDVDAATGKGVSRTLMSNLVTPTALVMVDGGVDAGKPTLYIQCVGAVHPARLTGREGTWLKQADVDSSKIQVLVTVTTEVTYSSLDEDMDGRTFWVTIA